MTFATLCTHSFSISHIIHLHGRLSLLPSLPLMMSHISSSPLTSHCCFGLGLPLSSSPSPPFYTQVIYSIIAIHLHSISSSPHFLPPNPCVLSTSNEGSLCFLTGSWHLGMRGRQGRQAVLVVLSCLPAFTCLPPPTNHVASILGTCPHLFMISLLFLP